MRANWFKTVALNGRNEGFLLFVAVITTIVTKVIWIKTSNSIRVRTITTQSRSNVGPVLDYFHGFDWDTFGRIWEMSSEKTIIRIWQARNNKIVSNIKTPPLIQRLVLAPYCHTRGFASLLSTQIFSSNDSGRKILNKVNTRTGFRWVKTGKFVPGGTLGSLNSHLFKSTTSKSGSACTSYFLFFLADSVSTASIISEIILN